MITEINNPTKYRYSVDLFGMRYFFLNREDAYKLDRYRLRMLSEREQMIYNAMPNVYKAISKSKVRLDLQDKQALSLMENTVNHVIQRHNKQNYERLIMSGFNGLRQLNRVLSLRLDLPADVVEMKFKSKWMCISL